MLLLLLLSWCHSGIASAASEQDLAKSFETLAVAAKGKVGVAVELIETGESISFNGQQRFPLQSIYKLPIAMAVLHQVDERGLSLDQAIQVTTNDFVSPQQHSPIRDQSPQGTVLRLNVLLQQMVSESDGTACDVLLRLLGGPAAVGGYLGNLGLTNLTVATTEKAMGQDELVQYLNWSTPAGMVELLRALQLGQGVSASNQKLLLGWLTQTPTGPHRLKALLPPGTRVAHKTGSSRTNGNLTRATNDAGIVTLRDGRHLAIAVLVSDSTADEATREAVIARISRAAWDYWTTYSPRPIRQ